MPCRSGFGGAGGKLFCQAFDTKPSDNQAFVTESSAPNPRHLILRRCESTACTQPEARVTVTHAEHRSIRKRMVGMSPKRERFAAASYSICALLAEVSAPSTMTLFISIHRYYMVNKLLIFSVPHLRWIICTR
jgi:hypothetical protein